MAVAPLPAAFEEALLAAALPPLDGIVLVGSLTLPSPELLAAVDGAIFTELVAVFSAVDGLSAELEELMETTDVETGDTPAEVLVLISLVSTEAVVESGAGNVVLVVSSAELKVDGILEELVTVTTLGAEETAALELLDVGDTIVLEISLVVVEVAKDVSVAKLDVLIEVVEVIDVPVATELLE